MTERNKHKHRPSWPAESEVLTTSTCWVEGYNVLHHQQLQEQLQPLGTINRDSTVSGY